MNGEKLRPLVPRRLANLARILEIKRTVFGGEKRFECGVLSRNGAHLVVLFIAPDAMNVHGVALPAGTITFGHFWTDRPYNVYHWVDRMTGATIGHYINLSTDTVVTEDRLYWLDLIVDVLILPGETPKVLDEGEIPPTMDPALRARLDDARRIVLAGATDLVTELEAERRTLWPRVEPMPRAGP